MEQFKLKMEKSSNQQSQRSGIAEYDADNESESQGIKNYIDLIVNILLTEVILLILKFFTFSDFKCEQ